MTGAPAPASDAQLDDYLSRPTEAAIRVLRALEGDLVVIGAGGKMGHSLSRMAVRAWQAAGQTNRRVTAVSRFGSAATRDAFERDGIATIASDLLEPGALDTLPDARNVLYLAGMKFGSTGDEASTWAMNAFLPGLVARRYASARIVALSTANVYAFTTPASGGATESGELAPIGEYAQSCLGRERILAWHARRNATPVALIRLSYANALTYGVLVGVAQKVVAGSPIDVAMGHANVIWQGDANAQILVAFSLAANPAGVLNVSGAEQLSVRATATRMAELFGVAPPTFTGEEAATALLIDSSRAHALAGPPSVPLSQLVDWTVAWLQVGGRLLGKPTHFEARDGRF